MRHSVQRSIKTSAGGLGPTRRFFADLFRWRQIHSASEFDELHGLWKKTRSKLLYDRMLYGSSYIVKGVASRLSRNPYDTDLLQEGYIGVMKGIEEYDASRKVHFGTFFSWKIRGEMGRYIQNNRLDRPVRLPVHLLQRDIHIKRERDRYIAEHGRAPNNKTLLAWIHRHDHTPEATKIAATMTLEHLKESAQRQGERAIRLEAFVGGDEQVKTFADIIGPIHHDYDTLILVRQLLQKLTEALKRILQQLHELVEIGTITRRASEFLCLRYGIGVARALTLEEIAQRYSCSRQNVQQQVAQTFAKLFKCIRLTTNDLQGLASGIALLAEMADDSETAALVAENISLTTLPKSLRAVKNTDELIQAIDCLGQRHPTISREPKVVQVRTKPPEFTVLRSIATYFRVSSGAVLDTRKRSPHRSTHLLLTHLLKHKLDWDTERSGEFLELTSAGIEANLTEFERLRRLDTNFDYVTTAFESLDFG